MWHHTCFVHGETQFGPQSRMVEGQSKKHQFPLRYPTQDSHKQMLRLHLDSNLDVLCF